ncbi:MAG: carboxylating nicotinate-nucleotide diphosphorylase [Candidatus Omnitrophica bacterium]|nr:carboxylating nicotinate-nucleotide diphosphorylase [Candidatus Omnitrophota bacterium]
MIALDKKLDHILRAALREDVGGRDLTSSMIDADLTARGDVVFKSRGVLCGLSVAERIYRLVDENLRFLPVAKDGELIEPGRAIFYLEGSARSILTGERTALNFLSEMSGVATLTRQFVEKVKNTKVAIYDTRKTLPNFRALDRYSVRVGGGHNHRRGLYDGVLFKENHWTALAGTDMVFVIKRARARYPRNVPIGVEVRSLDELRALVKSAADFILLDNFDLPAARQAVRIRNDSGSAIPLEISGGVTLDTVEAYAATGVERISVGALTHSAKPPDLSLNLL